MLPEAAPSVLRGDRKEKLVNPISADSHVMEAEDVFVGLADRFGDEAPRVMYAGTEQDAIVIPAKGARGIRKRMGWAGMRLRDGVPIERRPGHKPEVDNLNGRHQWGEG